MKTEKHLQDYLKKCAKSNSMLFYKLHCEGQRGFPDVMLIDDGRQVLVELKSPSKTGRLSRLQIETHEQMRLHGVYVHVIDSKETADALIKELVNTRSSTWNGEAL